MAYKVVITEDAQADLDRFINYLIFDKNSKQAGSNVLEDFKATIDTLSFVAGSLKYCDNRKLKENGYRRINFMSHKYFMLYRIEDERVIVDNIFHELQDYENKML